MKPKMQVFFDIWNLKALDGTGSTTNLPEPSTLYKGPGS
jgi:hypothetical protein